MSAQGNGALSTLRERFLNDRDQGLIDIVVYGVLLLLIKFLSQTHIKNVCKLGYIFSHVGEASEFLPPHNVNFQSVSLKS